MDNHGFGLWWERVAGGCLTASLLAVAIIAGVEWLRGWRGRH